MSSLLRSEVAAFAANETASLERVVAQQATELAALRQTAERSAIDATIAGAIDASGLELHPGARGQITELLRNEITLVNHGGGPAIPVGPGLAPAAKHIADRLASDQFSHFVKGRALSPATPATPAGRQTEIEASTLGARMIAHAQQQAAARQAVQGDPRTNMTLPYGLRRQR
jgi:hypothetical protein